MKLTSRSPEETDEIGYKLGRMLKPGEVVGLYGDLGTGKTTMVKGIARAFGIAERDITSASFTIIAEYPVSPPFHHIDLYRIAQGDDLEGTGIWDCMGEDSISVIEWAERLGADQPEHFIKVTITAVDDVREIEIEGIDEKNRDNL